MEVSYSFRRREFSNKKKRRSRSSVPLVPITTYVKRLRRVCASITLLNNLVFRVVVVVFTFKIIRRYAFPYTDQKKPTAVPSAPPRTYSTFVSPGNRTNARRKREKSVAGVRVFVREIRATLPIARTYQRLVFRLDRRPNRTCPKRSQKFDTPPPHKWRFVREA